MLKNLLVSILLVVSLSADAAAKVFLAYQFNEYTLIALSTTDVCEGTDKKHVWHTAVMQRIDGPYWLGCYIRGDGILKDMYIIIWSTVDPAHPYDRSELPVEWFKQYTDEVPDKPAFEPAL